MKKNQLSVIHMLYVINHRVKLTYNHICHCSKHCMSQMNKRDWQNADESTKIPCKDATVFKRVLLTQLPASLHLITKLKLDFTLDIVSLESDFHHRHLWWTYLELNNKFLYYWVTSWVKIKCFLYRKISHFLQNVWRLAFSEIHRSQIFLQTFITRIAIGKTLDIYDQRKSLISKANTHWCSSLEISV